MPTDAGEVILANCSNVIVENTNPDWGTVGILVGFSDDNTFGANNLSNNLYGLHLYSSDSNTILNNTVSYNSRFGIELVSSSFNLIYHNNIIENANQAYDDRANNNWNETYSVCGNYWSDYIGVDIRNGPFQDILGSDGIGDTPYTIDGNSNDYYPLMNPWDPASSLPTEPLTLIANAGNIFINLSWSPPVDDGGYPVFKYIIYKDTISGTEIFYMEIGNNLTFNDTNVTVGVTYYYKIRAVTIMGESSLSNEAFGMPYSEPSEPLGLIASSGDSYVNLTWNPPIIDGGFPVTNYTVYRGEIPGIPTYSIEIGNITFFNDTTAINGITYYYNITAKNSVGEGPKSSEASAIPQTIPGAPLGIIFQEGDAYINLTWNPPSDDGGSAIIGYNIYRDDIPGVHQFVPAGQLWFNDTSVTNGVTYAYIITAINGVGEGPPSLEMNATPKRPPFGPLNLQAAVGDTLVNLTWLPPSNNGGSAVTGYRIYKGTESGNLAFLAELGNILFFEDINVTNGNIYYYTVSAINIIGEGSPSIETSAIPATIPGAPTGLTADAGDAYIELSWLAPSSNGGSPITDYVIYRSTTSGSGFIQVGEVNDLYYNDTGLSNGVTYFYIVVSKNIIGESPFSNEANDTPQGPPSTPVNIQAQSGESYIYISWEIPISDGGSPITKYMIYRGTSSGDEEYLTEVLDVLYYNDTTGEGGTEYFFMVSAVNNIGESTLSSEVSGIPYAYPTAPLNVTASTGDSYIYISWDIPESQGSSSITNYIIYKGTDSGEEILLIEIGNTLFYNDTTVTNGVTYYYYIIAKNSEGTGPESEEINGTPVSVPGTSTNINANPGNGFVHLTWNAPSSDGGSAITNYRIYRGTTSGDLTLLAEIGNILTYNDTTVTNGVTYYFMITSVNSIGEAPQSSEISVAPFVDTDGDSQPDHEDSDDDNDGLSDSEELEIGTDSLKADTDGDGHDDGEDEFPLNSDKWKKEEPESGFPIWILIIIIIIVLILVLFLATRKKGKPEEEPPKPEEKEEHAFEEIKEPEVEEDADKEGVAEPSEPEMEQEEEPKEEEVTGSEELKEDEPELGEESKEEEPGAHEESKEDAPKEENTEENKPNTGEESIIDEILNENKDTDSPSDNPPSPDDETKP
jgi:parallel beta-helix repeat protein